MSADRQQYDPNGMPPNLVLRHGRKEGKTRAEQEREMADLIVRSHGGRPTVPAGELGGVRDTREQLIAQEVAGGCDAAVARAQLDRVAADYDRSVREGRTPLPRRG